MKHPTILCILCLLLSAPPAFAQLEVTMNSGAVLTGARVAETTNSLTLKVFLDGRERFHDVVLNKERIVRVYDLAQDRDVSALYLPQAARNIAVNADTPLVRPYHLETTAGAQWRHLGVGESPGLTQYTVDVGGLYSSTPLVHDDAHRTDASKAVVRKSWVSVRGTWGPLADGLPPQSNYRLEGAVQISRGVGIGAVAWTGRRIANDYRYAMIPELYRANARSGSEWGLGLLVDLYSGNKFTVRESISLGALRDEYESYYGSYDRTNEVFEFVHSMHAIISRELAYSNSLLYRDTDGTGMDMDFVNRLEIAPSPSFVIAPQLSLHNSNRYHGYYGERDFSAGLGVMLKVYMNERSFLQLEPEYVFGADYGGDARIGLQAGVRF